ncbi:MAG: glucan-glucohydrolase [Moraxellaceae bacterium]|nr:MAG: glucan-glucohydrolase [Moraxellaceae bacterium]
MQKGVPIARTVGLGDPSNWSLVIQGRAGKSASGKVEVSPTDYKGGGDAMQIKWSKKSEQGNFSMYGAAVDLTAFQKVANLVVEMRVDVMPDKPVSLGMDCGYPCGATVNLSNLIKSMPKGQWFGLPIPLSCFKSNNFDISKVVGPIVISTQGKLTLSLTNIHLEKMGPDDKGCE